MRRRSMGRWLESRLVHGTRWNTLGWLAARLSGRGCDPKYRYRACSEGARRRLAAACSHEAFRRKTLSFKWRPAYNNHGGGAFVGHRARLTVYLQSKPLRPSYTIRAWGGIGGKVAVRRRSEGCQIVHICQVPTPETQGLRLVLRIQGRSCIHNVVRRLT